MNPFLITLAGPLLGVAGWLTGVQVLFWIGVVVCAATLFLNLASGVMKLPVLPVACIALFSGLVSPWWRGAASGLVVWTAFEAAGEVWIKFRRAKP